MQARKKTIFLVDDDEDDCDLFRIALKSLGCEAQCICAFDGVNALEQISHPDFTIPDLIVLDLNMPRMNGRELLVNLRQLPDYAQIPVITYSTTSAPAHHKMMLELGAAAFLTKHNSMPRMCEDLEQILCNYDLIQPSVL